MSITYKNELTPNRLFSTSSQKNVNSILKNECDNNKHEPWTKLNKTTKINKMHLYADTLGKQFELTESELESLKLYLQTNLDRKRLTSVKDVIYNKESETIQNIPSLLYIQTTRKFTIKRSERRTSTLKSLGKGNRSKNSDTNNTD